VVDQALVSRTVINILMKRVSKVLTSPLSPTNFWKKSKAWSIKTLVELLKN